jgi:hypothetical protein
MIDYKNFPKNSILLKAISKKITDIEVKQSLNRYTYRYRLARCFNGLDISEVDKRTKEGYSVVAKLFFAYTAYDEVRFAEQILLKRSKQKIHHVFNFAVANKLRRNKALEYVLKNSPAVNSKTLLKNIHRFYDEGNNEVMCIATAIRNCFAHGDFTAGGAKLQTKAMREPINELAEVVFEKSNQIFNEILGAK